MTIYVFPADMTGCGYYRLIWPSEVLIAQGHNIKIITAQDRDKALTASIDRNGRVVDVNIPADAELMVFQRVTHKFLAQAVEVIRNKGVAVVMDIDDDLANIHPSNPAFTFLHPRDTTQPDHTWHNTQRVADAVTMMVVSTPALLGRYAKHGRGAVYYNYVQQKMIDIQHWDSPMVGWAGSVSSHPEDLQTMGFAMQQLAQEGHMIANVGSDGSGVREAWRIPEELPIHFSGIIDISMWGDAVSRLGVGVAPLADTRFNAAKSWLKMAEYAACGVPCIGSPRVEYVRLNQLGVGLLAKSPQDWYRKLKRLLANSDERLEMAEKGREVMRSMTIEQNAWRLLEIWNDAIALQHGAKVGAGARAF